MIPRIRRLVAQQIIPNEDQARTAALLNTILLAVLAVLSIYFAVRAVFDPHWPTLFFVALWAIALGSVWVLLQRGSVRAASLWFCLITLAGIMLAAAIFGGVRSSSYSALILTVILAGILIGGRAAAIWSALSIGWGLILMVGEANGWYVSPTEYLTPFTVWLGQALALSLTALLLGLTSRSIRGAQVLVRDSQQQLADSHERLRQRTRELEEQRTQLLHERDSAARLDVEV